jgi:hypothetical protein
VIASVSLRIDPHFIASTSFGTIAHIEILREECGLGVAAAKAIVDRCVFDGETVVLEVDAKRAARLVERLAAVPSPPLTHVGIVSESA